MSRSTICIVWLRDVDEVLLGSPAPPRRRGWAPASQLRAVRLDETPPGAGMPCARGPASRRTRPGSRRDPGQRYPCHRAPRRRAGGAGARSRCARDLPGLPITAGMSDEDGDHDDLLESADVGGCNSRSSSVSRGALTAAWPLVPGPRLSEAARQGTPTVAMETRNYYVVLGVDPMGRRTGSGAFRELVHQYHPDPRRFPGRCPSSRTSSRPAESSRIGAPCVLRRGTPGCR